VGAVAHFCERWTDPVRPGEPHPRPLPVHGRARGGENDHTCSVYEPRLEIVATLADAYENEHQPMDPSDPIEAIEFRMEQQGLI
jgi:hypothetical protein